MSIYLQKTNDRGFLLCLDEEAYRDLPPVGQYSLAQVNTGTETMLRTWRGWMAIIAKHMTANGATMPLWFKSDGQPYGSREFNADDAHEAFTKILLGLDENGRRYSWAMSKKIGEDDPNYKPLAPKSKRLFAMEKMQAWALQRGIVLPTKENSEFFQLQREQER